MMIVHKTEEGIFIAAKLVGKNNHLNYTTLEVAGVGYNEQDLQKKSISYNQGQCFFQSLDRASASEKTEGLVKVLINCANDEMVGMYITGPRGY